MENGEVKIKNFILSIQQRHFFLQLINKNNNVYFYGENENINKNNCFLFLLLLNQKCATI